VFRLKRDGHSRFYGNRVGVVIFVFHGYFSLSFS
jgi:hypothetical protein